MPETLRLGATGPEVVRLQARLNVLPSARPPLVMDGVFGPKTLQRVREFQRKAFVHGVVDDVTWTKLLEGEPPPRATFYVSGRHLYDPNGNKIILRGANLPLLDDWDFPGNDRLADLEQTGANCVRIQWYIDYGNPARPAYTLANLDAFLAKCKANRIIPILGLWDIQCPTDAAVVNTRMIPWWMSDEVVSILNKHKQYLIINLANELGRYRWADNPATGLSEFKNAYKTALTSIREKFHMPVMIDGPDCGSSIDAFLTVGQELIDHDPDHNLLLSAHAYWAGYDGMPHIDSAVHQNLPVVFGEVANKQDDATMDAVHPYCYYDLDGSNENHQPPVPFAYQNLLQTLKTQEIGWLAWSWWPDSCPERNMGSYNQNTHQFEGLTPFGDDIVNHPDYGLKNTAVRSTIF